MKCILARSLGRSMPEVILRPRRIAMTTYDHPETLVDRVAAQTPLRIAKRVRGLSDRSIAWLSSCPRSRCCWRSTSFH